MAEKKIATLIAVFILLANADRRGSPSGKRISALLLIATPSSRQKLALDLVPVKPSTRSIMASISLPISRAEGSAGFHGCLIRSGAPICSSHGKTIH